jgi:hypothetical protein
MLRRLPKDLGKTYNRCLDRMNDNAEEQKFVSRMFEWLLFARRALTVEEMREAIAFTDEDLTQYNKALLPNSLHRLINACGCLIIIDDVTNTVQFAHYSIQQHLRNPGRHSLEGWTYQVSDCERAVTYTCLTYLSFSDFETQVVSYKSSNVRDQMEDVGKSLLPNPIGSTFGAAATRLAGKMILEQRPKPKSSMSATSKRSILSGQHYAISLHF